MRRLFIAVVAVLVTAALIGTIAVGAVKPIEKPKHQPGANAVVVQIETAAGTHTAGESCAFTISTTPTLNAPFRYMIHWEDGSVATQGVKDSGQTPFAMSHTYSQAGVYTVDVTLSTQDKHGKYHYSNTATRTVTIDDPAPTCGNPTALQVSVNKANVKVGETLELYITPTPSAPCAYGIDVYWEGFATDTVRGIYHSPVTMPITHAYPTAGTYDLSIAFNNLDTNPPRVLYEHVTITVEP